MTNSTCPDASYRWELPFGCMAHFAGPAFDLESPVKRAAWLGQLPYAPPVWVMPKQQHGSRVLNDFIISPQLDNQCDGLATNNPHIGLGVFGSDCPGVAVIAPDALGLAHCGWRGISTGIIENLVTSVLAVSQFHVSAFQGFVGPGICQSCYEVKTDLLDAYPWPQASLRRDTKGSAFLDLSHAIDFQLKRCGLTQVFLSQVCTACSPHLHSNRHQGPGVVQVLAVHKRREG